MADDSITLERENQDSVEISRTSKGETSFRVKVFRKPERTLEQTLEVAEWAYARLDHRYPAKEKP